MNRTIPAAALVLSTFAFADDRVACTTGDNAACARIGELKRNGALKADGTADKDKLVETCTAALEQATSPKSMWNVSSACRQLFNLDLQKGWYAVAHLAMPGVEKILGTAYAEAYCPSLDGSPKGCRGKHPANFSAMNNAEARVALRALNAKALEMELGPAKAGPLVAKFDAAWDHLLGAP
jgi:hypothetical protein